MDPIEKNHQKDDTIRLVKCNDHTVDRQGGKKSRDKSNPNRKSEKSTISGQKSPFKSKYTADKQFSRAPFGHSGLSSKSFSRRHIQENAPAFYGKPTKLGKLAKEIKKQPVDLSISAKKTKSTKNYSPIRVTSDAHPDDVQMINMPSCSNNTMHMSSSDKNNNRSPENAPRHRKCYTNSKHAEFTKTLKLLDKCQSKDIKVSQSVGNLKKNSTNDEVKHASADDIHCCVEKDDMTFNKDIFLKTIHKAASKNENVFFANNYCTTVNITKPHTLPRETTSPKESASGFVSCVNFANDDNKAESDQPKSNLSYFYKGTDNKMNLEGSDISGVKILLRGDLLGALNCLFPQLNLVASEANPKKPQLDPNFSYFSDSSDILMETFTLAKRLFNEQTRKSTEASKNNRTFFTDSVITLQNQNEKNTHFDECFDKYKSNIKQNTIHTQHLAVRGIVSAKDLHFDSTKDSNISKVSLGNRFQQHIKCSQSESKINTVGLYRNNLNNGLDSSSEESSRIHLAPKDRVNSLRDIEKIITAIDKIPASIDDQKQLNTRLEQTVQNGSESCRRSLYSSVLKRSMSNNDNAYIEKKLVETSALVDCQMNLWDDSRSDILASATDENKNDSISSFTLDSQIFTDNTDLQKSPSAVSRVPVIYDQDELEKDIVKNLEKLIDEPDMIPPFNQYAMQSSGLSNSNNLNDPTSNQFLTNHTQKYSESYYRKQTVGNTSPTNSLQSRLNFLRTKGRPSDFEQFFNPLAFNTQLAAQFLRQDNVNNNINSVPMDSTNPINQLFPRADLTKLPTNAGYYQQSSVNTFERDIKELLTRYPQIVQNNSANIHQQNIMPANSNLASSTPFDLASLYAHLAATKSQVSPLPQPLAKTNNTDENLILNQFIASQSLENIYNNNAGYNRFQLSNNKFPNHHIPFDSNKHTAMGSAGMGIGMLNQESFPTPNYLDTNNFNNNNFTNNTAGGMRTIISVSDLEKQALEQYRNSEESINARYDVLEKEAEEQYNNCLSQK